MADHWWRRRTVGLLATITASVALMLVSESRAAATSGTATLIQDLTISQSVSPGPYNAAGQVVTYSVTVVNTGASSVGGLTVAGSIAGGPAAASCPTTTLAPTQSADCSISYAITQADLDSGTITESAVASGTDLTSGTPVSSETLTDRIRLTSGPPPGTQPTVQLPFTGTVAMTPLIGFGLVSCLLGLIFLAFGQRLHRQQMRPAVPPGTVSK